MAFGLPWFRRKPDPTPPAGPTRLPAALTGSVASVQLEGVGWQTWRPGALAWQVEGWRQYDICGQLRFVSNWVGHSVSRCRLYVAQVDDSGEAGKEAEDPDIANLASGPLGVGPAKDEALRLLAINLYVPGEAYIVAEADAGDDGSDRWFVVSGKQIKKSGQDITIRRSLLHGGGDMVFRPGIDLILRVWTPHPADTDEPDSPTRSAIPDLREIEAIRKREFAELDSRLAGAGLLPLPDDMDYPKDPNDPNDPGGMEGFSRRLSNTMARSLSDRGSAESIVPIIIPVPKDVLGKIQQVTFWSELSAQLLPLREAAVVSLAQSLDIPAEILTGQADANHWSAWAISEDAITTQIVPILSRIADALTTGWLRAALEEIGEDPGRYVFQFDTSPLTVRPNRSADALSYHAVGLISNEAAVEAGAFRADEMPSAEERLLRMAENAVVQAPSVALLDPDIRALIGLAPVVPPPVAPGPVAPSPSPPPPAPAPSEPKALPQPAPQTEQPAAAALIPVAGLAVRRALTLAGGRLIPHQRRDQYPDTPRHQLHTRHGSVTAAKADAVLRGAWDDLPVVAAELDLDPGQLEKLLHEFTCVLLTRGMAYEQQLLNDLLRTAMRGQRLAVFAGAA